VRSELARSVMRLGPVHVAVVIPSPALRSGIVAWLKQDKRVTVVRAAANAADLGAEKVDCDLVLASGLEGPRELRALSRKFGKSAGLVALSLGTTALPAGWVPLLPGAAQAHALDHAVAHPERSIAKTSAVLASILVAAVAVVMSIAWIPDSAVSFDRAALAYAARFPTASTWWHTWGAGAPYLAAPSWPLLKLGAALGGGPEMFTLMAAAVAALFGVSFYLLALRAGAKGWSVVAALAAVAPPALWVWPRAGDLASLTGLTGVVLALAGTQVGRLRILTVALAVAVASFGGYPWVLGAALAAAIGGIRARRARVSATGAVLGILISTAVTLPPLLSRGLEALRPPLARPPAVSDVVPLVACAALLAVVLARGRTRAATVGIAAVVLAGANALAFAVPVPAVTVPRVESTGPHGRLAVHPAEALALAVRSPHLPTTGDELSGPLILGQEPKDLTNTRLEWLGVDRAMLPDRTSAVIYNERDWPVLDRERLLLEAPRVRPILTAGITPSLLVVADPSDAQVFGEALIRLAIPSDVVIPVVFRGVLDDLYVGERSDRDLLRQFTMLVIYGRPWNDVSKAEAVLDDYLKLSGFVLWDTAGRTGRMPLVGEAETLRAEDGRASGPAAARIKAASYAGRAVGIDRFAFLGDQTWEQAALTVGDKRVLQYGQSVVAGDAGVVQAHMLWSGLDIPARAAAGEQGALDQLQDVLVWMLTDAGGQRTTGYGRPDGKDVLENDLATVEFVDPTKWVVTLKAATTGILFKERFHEQWRALQVDTQALTQVETRVALRLRPTTHGYMFVTLPPNARKIEFVFERHPLEAASRGVSGVAAFITLGLTFFILRQRR
jgi:hypothetical protein